MSFPTPIKSVSPVIMVSIIALNQKKRWFEILQYCTFLLDKSVMAF